MVSSKKPKVIFFGTSDRSTPILEALHANLDLALCITKSDTKVGRKQILQESGVKKWAKENNIEFLEIDNLKEPALTEVLNTLKDYDIDLGVVADFSYIIPEKLISTLNNRLINIHFSLLPKYRGASPVQHAILNGDAKTGITFMLTDKGMDTGNILYQIEYKLVGRETAGELYTTLFALAAQELPKVLKDFVEGKITQQKQDESQATYCYSPSHPKNTFIYKEDAQIDWTQDAVQIDRAVRAYNPWPIAWTTTEALEKARFNDFQRKDTSKDLRVQIYETKIVGELLRIERLKVEGKQMMSWDDFINGYSLA